MGSSDLPQLLQQLRSKSLPADTSDFDTSLQTRAETLAKEYLGGRRLFILSATLRGPFQLNWQSPWAAAADDTTHDVPPIGANLSDECPSSLPVAPPHSSKLIPAVEPRSPLAIADPNRKVEAIRKGDLKMSEMAKASSFKEQIVEHALSAIAANPKSKNIQVYEDVEDPEGSQREISPTVSSSAHPLELNEAVTVSPVHGHENLQLEAAVEKEFQTPAALPGQSITLAAHGLEPQFLSQPITLTDKETSVIKRPSSFPQDVYKRNEAETLEHMWPGGRLKTAHEFHGELISLLGEDAESRLQQILHISAEPRVRKTIRRPPASKPQKTKLLRSESQESDFVPIYRSRKGKGGGKARKMSFDTPVIKRASKRLRQKSQKALHPTTNGHTHFSGESKLDCVNPGDGDETRAGILEQEAPPQPVSGGLDAQAESPQICTQAAMLKAQLDFQQCIASPTHPNLANSTIHDEPSHLQRALLEDSDESKFPSKEEEQVDINTQALFDAYPSFSDTPTTSSSKKRARFSDHNETFELSQTPCQSAPKEPSSSLRKSALKTSVLSRTQTPLLLLSSVAVSNSDPGTEAGAPNIHIEPESGHDSLETCGPSFLSEEEWKCKSSDGEAPRRNLAANCANSRSETESGHENVAVLNPSFSSTEELDLNAFMEDVNEVLSV